jgi:F-type H+-transporting ATPase subunit b
MLLTTILAAEQDGISLLPDISELIWGLVAFLLLMGVMIKLVFPKLNATLVERAAAIQGKMEEADRTLQESEDAKRRFEANIADARGEANRIIEEAKSTADQILAEARNRAEVEAAQIVERARTEISAERERVVQELRGEVATLSVELAGKIVERELDAATHSSLVDEYINRLTTKN